jgi:hypothetical protein
VDQFIGAALTGTGALTAQTRQLHSIPAAFSGAGALTADLQVLKPTVLVKSGELDGGRTAVPRLTGNSTLFTPKK